MRTIPTFALTLCFLIVATAAGQDARQRASGARRSIALTEVCGGAWQEVQSAVDNLRHFDAVTSMAGRAKIECLLAAANDQTFTPSDVELDRLLASQMIRILVSAYGPANYDLFAELLAAQPERVKRGLTAALIEHGHPAAFEAYFAERRAIVDRRGTLAAGAGAVRLFRPLIERGTCNAALCSSRIDETLRIVQANLDLVALELQAAQENASSNTGQDVQIRSEAKELLEVIGRVQRGERPIGALR